MVPRWPSLKIDRTCGNASSLLLERQCVLYRKYTNYVWTLALKGNTFYLLSLKVKVKCLNSQVFSWLLVLLQYQTIFNRPGVAGAVLQTPSLLINSLIH